MLTVSMFAKNRPMHFRDGVSIRDISRRTGLPRNTVRHWLREAKEDVQRYPASERLAECLARLCIGGPRGLVVGQIHLQRQKFWGTGVDRVRQRRHGARGSGDAITAGQELSRGSLADAFRCAGDEPGLFGLAHDGLLINR